ncbi:peptidoglycan DD-metalloendopeptidase family protein [candidate division WOR-3 bacterium]|nr:peptidoglycan DD-metalloendopeptidase family protein [candidate division WOR-3 bacterium]
MDRLGPCHRLLQAEAKVKRLLPWLCLIPLILAPVLVLSQSRAESERELASIRSRLKEIKKELSSLKVEEKGVLKEINLLEEQVRLTRRLIGELRASQNAIEGEIDSLQTVVDSLGREIEGSKDDLRSRLVSLYKRGQFYELEVILGGNSVAEIYDRIYFTRYAARAEERMFDRLLAARAAIEEKEDSLAGYNTELSALIGDQRSARDSLAASKRTQEKRLNRIRSSAKSKQQLQKELDSRRRELEGLLARMEKSSSGSADRKPTGTVIEKGKGTLPWPVASRKVIAKFGTVTHPRYNTKTENDGIDIDCSGGQTVKAIKEGKIKYAEYLSGFGLLVIVDHADGYYSVYSNLDKISVKRGQSVSQGSAVGAASDYLHFCITKGGSFLNPVNYLK